MTRAATIAALLAASIARADARVGVGLRPPPVPTYTGTRTVATTTTAANGWSTIYQFQRKLFKIGSLYWLFYTDGTDHVFRTSADGVTWSSAGTVKSVGGTLGHRIGYWYDGTYIHYAYNAAEDGSDTLYRRGTPESNGTITWSAAEQTALAISAGSTAGYPNIMVDSTGAPWIFYALTAYSAGFATPYAGAVTKASTTDGTWTTDTGFPYTFTSGHTAVFPNPIGVALTGGKLLAIYSSDDGAYGTPYKGRLWSGSAWGDVENVSATNSAHNQYHLLADGDVVHLVFEDVPNKKLYYRQRGAGGGWGTELLLRTNSQNAIPTMTLLDGAWIRVFWMDADTILYRDIRGGALVGDAALTLQDETTPDLANLLSLNAVPETTAPMVVYQTKTGTPWDVVTVKQTKN